MIAVVPSKLGSYADPPENKGDLKHCTMGEEIKNGYKGVTRRSRYEEKRWGKWPLDLILTIWEGIVEITLEICASKKGKLPRDRSLRRSFLLQSWSQS